MSSVRDQSQEMIHSTAKVNGLRNLSSAAIIPSVCVQG